MGHPEGLHRPPPVAADTPALTVDRASDVRAVAGALVRGERHRITDVYATGTRVLQALRTQLAAEHPGETHAERRAFRAALHEAGRNLLVPVEGHRLAVSKSPDIGWFPELYPEQADFLLAFPDVVGLNSAWQWRVRGLEIPVLHRKIHPFYGTYFPTRFDHLELFDDWLGEQGSPTTAVDVGVGSGVLTLLMLQRGVSAVHATDLNPNALLSTKDELRSAGLVGRVTLERADLLGGFAGDADLIVFNPPWLPGEVHGPLDLAIYYPDDLFPRFFEAARARLAPGGRVAVLFSSLVEQLTEGIHPVNRELVASGRFRLEEKLTRPVRAGSKKTRRSTEHRKEEEVQLWVLAPE